jgi:hypothetical protein
MLIGAGLLGAAALGLALTERRSAAAASVGAQRATSLRDTFLIEHPIDAAAPLQVAPGLLIHPRSEWGADLPPKGAMGSEDVRFLLVHHTASSNVVPDPRSVIRQTYAFQTGSSKGWADVCYHFFVGPDGSVWEGRAGSLDGPVLADATGGNQGFAQLICLIGNFVTETPTVAAQESLMHTMIFLADRYRIDSDPSASVTFTSRGSNKYRSGAVVTTSTISGHRDTSATACPGDVAYALLPTWRSRVHATRLHRDSTSSPRTATRLDLHLA